MDGRNPRLLPGKSIAGIPCARADDTQARVGAPLLDRVCCESSPIKQRCHENLFKKKWKFRFATFWFWCWKRRNFHKCEVWGWFDAIWKALWQMYFHDGETQRGLVCCGATCEYKSGQVRTARQCRTCFRAQAQKTPNMHNCHLHAAEGDK